MPIYNANCENEGCPDKGKSVEFFSTRFVDVDQSTARFIGKECEACREQMMKRIFSKPQVKVSMGKDELLARAMMTDAIENVPGVYNPTLHDGLFSPNFKRIVHRPDGTVAEYGKESFGKSSLELMFDPNPPKSDS